jgi:hypothetical protein
MPKHIAAAQKRIFGRIRDAKTLFIDEFLLFVRLALDGLYIIPIIRSHARGAGQRAREHRVSADGLIIA